MHRRVPGAGPGTPGCHRTRFAAPPAVQQRYRLCAPPRCGQPVPPKLHDAGTGSSGRVRSGCREDGCSRRSVSVAVGLRFSCARARPPRPPTSHPCRSTSVAHGCVRMAMGFFPAPAARSLCLRSWAAARVYLMPQLHHAARKSCTEQVGQRGEAERTCLKVGQSREMRR